MTHMKRFIWKSRIWVTKKHFISYIKKKGCETVGTCGVLFFRAEKKEEKQSLWGKQFALRVEPLHVNT